MSYYLALISPTDSPIYETHLTSSKPHNQIASSSTSTFPSWSTFPAFNQAQHVQAQQQAQSQSKGGQPPAAPSVPPKDPFPPQFLGTPGTRPPAHTSNSSSSQLPSGPPHGIEKHVLQMIAFSSLDIVEEVMGSTASMYLKMVDKVNEWNVSAFVAPAVKLVILHDIKNEEGIRLFFMDVWEHYVKTALNPFYNPTDKITSTLFDQRVRASAKRHL